MYTSTVVYKYVLFFGGGKKKSLSICFLLFSLSVHPHPPPHLQLLARAQKEREREGIHMITAALIRNPAMMVRTAATAAAARTQVPTTWHRFSSSKNFGSVGVPSSSSSSSSSSTLSRRSSAALRRFGTAAAVVVHSGQVKVAHILMDSKDESKLDELYERINADTATLADLAPENSACPSKSNGGVIGWISRGQTVRPFEDVAFTTPVGGVAKATTNFGVHIIQVLDAREAPPAPVDVSVLDLKEALEGDLDEIQLIDVREQNEWVGKGKGVAFDTFHFGLLVLY